MARLSQYSKDRRKMRTNAFYPKLDEWVDACEVCPFDTQIAKIFGISKETFYCFIDKERYKEEQDKKYKSEHLDIYKSARNKARKRISEAYFSNVDKHDTASVIFGMKTFNGLIESKDLELIKIKREQMMLKNNEFLLELATKFNLNEKQLKLFTKQYYKDVFDNE